MTDSRCGRHQLTPEETNRIQALPHTFTRCAQCTRIFESKLYQGIKENMLDHSEAVCLGCASVFCYDHYREHCEVEGGCQVSRFYVTFEDSEVKVGCRECDKELGVETYENLKTLLKTKLTPILSLHEAQGRILGNSIRAQAVSLGYAISRKFDSEDEYLSYDLSPFKSFHSSPHSPLHFLPFTDNPCLSSRLETLHTPWTYDLLIGISFPEGNEINFENTMKGIIQATCHINEIQSGDDDKRFRSLAVILIDNVELLEDDNLPLPKKLKKLNLYDKQIKDEFMEMANDVTDKIDSKSDLDLALVFESTLKYVNREIIAEFADTGSSDSLDVVLVVKHRSGGLLHSQLWLMAGFAEYLHPEYLLMMDIDVEPTFSSLHTMLNSLHLSNTVAVCGELEARTELNIVSLSQWFEYKMSYAMSKRIENIYGHVSALSHAFSMYEWEEVREVLFEYFQPFYAPTKMGWTLSNLYAVAPERVLSYYLFYAKADNQIKYISEASALVTPLVTFQQFLKNRWQLVAGQWFYLLYTANLLRKVLCCKDFSHPSHKQWKCWTFTLYWFFRFYFYIAIAISFVSVSGLYIALSIVSREVFDDAEANKTKYWSITSALQILYTLVFLISLLISISKSVERLIAYWKMVMLIYGLLSLFFFSTSVYMIYYSQEMTPKMILGIAGFAALWVTPILSSGVTSSFVLIKNTVAAACYLLMIPSYINVLTAITVTKTDDTLLITNLPGSTTSKLDQFGCNRTFLLVVFAIVNVLLGGIVDYYDNRGQSWIAALLMATSLGFLGIPLALLICETGYQCCHKTFKQFGNVYDRLLN